MKLETTALLTTTKKEQEQKQKCIDKNTFGSSTSLVLY